MKLTVGEIVMATKGKLIAGRSGATVSGVSTDSRTLKRGELFVALRGETHDGHDHLEDVKKKGAAGVVISRDVRTGVANVVRVEDTLRALGDLAHHWRKKFRLRVVGITGSNGKTTAKDMVASVLSTRFRVLKTQGNFNNLIGLPLTLFRLKGNEDVAVLEMGMNHFGEIDRLAEIAEPSVGLITNVGRAHLEGLGGLAGVAKAKGELLDRLPKNGVAVLNRDSPFFPVLKKRAKSAGAKVVSFGSGKEGDFRATDTEADLKGLRFTASFKGRKVPMTMPVLGRHNVLNALAALAVGESFGVPIVKMKTALRSFHAGSKRMEIVRVPKNVVIINDCYNANPDSMAAALDFLGNFGAPSLRRVAVLGDMLELGRTAAPAHREVGMRSARAGVSLLFAMGPHARDVVAGARSAGLGESSGFVFRSAEESIPVIRSLLRPGDIILVKGSRGMKMERVTEGLQGRSMH